jgi:Flp pilus assembly protein TadG
MSRRRPAARSGQQKERGATLIEFAIIVPLLAALLFGIIEFGVIYGDQINLRHGTRDAARLAVVGNFNAVASCSGSNAQKLACITRQRSNSNDARVRIRVPAGGGTGNPVIVCAQVPVTPVTGIFPFLNNRVLTSRTEMRLETTVTLSDFEEPSYPGTTWGTACPA